MPSKQNLTDTEQGENGAEEAWAGEWPQTAEEFEGFVEAFQNRLVARAFRRLRDIHDAEDLVQEVFIKAYLRRLKCRKIKQVGPNSVRH